MKMEEKAKQAGKFLKAIASEKRLLILCSLAQKDKCVSEILQETGFSQSVVSQHLSKMKKENLVNSYKEGKFVYYFISHPITFKIIEALYEEFCKKS